MRKLFLAIFLLAVPALAFAQGPPDFSKVQIQRIPVAGNVTMLQGAGGNIAASVGDDGALIVDAEYAPLADKIQAAIDQIAGSSKPVRFVINTHYHADHSDGDAAFGARGATIIATENLRKRLESGNAIGNKGAIRMQQPPAPKVALPIITYDEEMFVHFNGEEIRLMHFTAHTDGDSVVYFSKSNVVHMGDIFVRYGFPFVDLNGGGNIQGMIAACEKVIATAPPDAKVIPGHGELATIEDLRAYTQMMKDTTAAVQKSVAEGKTLEQMKQEKILAPWQKYSGNFVNSDAFIETIYYSLTAPSAQGAK
jgi:cyclase